MPTSNTYRAGFLETTAAEIKSLRNMRTWDPYEAQNETLIGMSRCVFTKRYNPDGTFDKYKFRIMFFRVTGCTSCIAINRTPVVS